MKKLIAAGATAAVLIVGAGVGAREATQSSSCAKPLTLFSSEQTASIKVLEEYIAENIAPTFKDKAFLEWESNDFNPVLTPGKIAAFIVVFNGSGHEIKSYHVTITRDCQGGDWKVVEFKKL